MECLRRELNSKEAVSTINQTSTWVDQTSPKLMFSVGPSSSACE